jgi:hypothetical protein
LQLRAGHQRVVTNANVPEPVIVIQLSKHFLYKPVSLFQIEITTWVMVVKQEDNAPSVNYVLPELSAHKRVLPKFWIEL